MKYKIAKQLYQKGLYEAVLRLAGDNTSHLRALPFKDGQPLKIQTKTSTVTGHYIGTIQDGFLVAVSGRPTTIPYGDIETISVYWH